MRRVTATALLLAGTAAFGSPSDPCSLTSTVTDAKIGIAIPDGRTSFREGEIIPLVLSFTSTADKRYWGREPQLRPQRPAEHRDLLRRTGGTRSARRLFPHWHIHQRRLG